MAGQQPIHVKNTLDSEGKIWVMERSAAEHSAVIRMCIEDNADTDFSENPVPITIGVSNKCLDLVFSWAEHWKEMPKVDDEEIAKDDKAVTFSSWDLEFFGEVGQSDMLYEILIATNYLDIIPLYDMACQVVVNMIIGKSAEQIRKVLGLAKDFTPEEEEAIRKETEWAFEKNKAAVAGPSAPAEAPLA